MSDFPLSNHALTDEERLSFPVGASMSYDNSLSVDVFDLWSESPQSSAGGLCNSPAYILGTKDIPEADCKSKVQVGDNRPYCKQLVSDEIKINIRNIKQLGSDRIVNSVEAKRFKNCLIIDFGTATTFDIVRHGAYEGGVIAPGVKLSIKNLSQSTALLPIFSLKNKQKSYGKNTKDALNAGFIWGYDGLINNIINKITHNWKMNYKIILTGGYANLFQKVIKRNVIVDQNITIKGVSKVYKELL